MAYSPVAKQLMHTMRCLVRVSYMSASRSARSAAACLRVLCWALVTQTNARCCCCCVKKNVHIYILLRSLAPPPPIILLLLRMHQTFRLQDCLRQGRLRLQRPRPPLAFFDRKPELRIKRLAARVSRACRQLCSLRTKLLFFFSSQKPFKLYWCTRGTIDK